MRVVFAGALGRMGRVLVPALRETPDVEVVGALDRDDDLSATLAKTTPDALIDFTTPATARAHAEAGLAAGAHVLMGTTGLSASDRSALDGLAQRAGRAIVVAPNFSLGMVLVQQAADLIATHLPHVEVYERHHPEKLDAPSGTARRTAERLAAHGAQSPVTASGDTARGMDVNGVRVHSARLPGVHAQQDVVFGSSFEGVTLRHDAYSRRCYLPGIVLALRVVSGRVGLHYGLESLLEAGS